MAMKAISERRKGVEGEQREQTRRMLSQFALNGKTEEGRRQNAAIFLKAATDSMEEGDFETADLFGAMSQLAKEGRNFMVIAESRQDLLGKVGQLINPLVGSKIGTKRKAVAAGEQKGMEGVTSSGVPYKLIE